MIRRALVVLAAASVAAAVAGCGDAAPVGGVAGGADGAGVPLAPGAGASLFFPGLAEGLSEGFAAGFWPLPPGAAGWAGGGSAAG